MKEEEIRKRETFSRYLQLAEEDARRIFRDKTSFQDAPCPGCGAPKGNFQFEKAGFTYVQCPGCETLYVNPRPAFPHLMEIYADSPSTKYWVEEFFKPMIEPRREKIFKPRAEYISGRFPGLAEKSVADIGAGFGLFLEELRRVWPKARFTAIEPSSDMARICRDKKFPVLESMMEELDPSRHRFHLLTAFELFEHLHEPRAFLKKVHALLEAGGYFFMTTLNGLGLDIQVLWEKSKSVSPPHHLNFLNPRALAGLLEAEGFRVIECSTPGQLDWDILESSAVHEGADPGRFFRTLIAHGRPESKEAFQKWVRESGMSSHMRVVAQKK